MRPACTVKALRPVMPLRSLKSMMPPNALPYRAAMPPVSKRDPPNICALRMVVPPPVSVGRSLGVPAFVKWFGVTISAPSNSHALLEGPLPRTLKWFAWSLVEATPA